MTQKWFKLEEIRNSFGIEKDIFYDRIEAFIENLFDSYDMYPPISVYFDKEADNFNVKIPDYSLDRFIDFLTKRGDSFNSNDILSKIEEAYEENKKEDERIRREQLMKKLYFHHLKKLTKHV